jgi:hypothetical protein
VAADLGELKEPVRNWDDLNALLDAAISERILKTLSTRKPVFLAARYRRTGTPGVLALLVSPGSPPEVLAMESASSDLDVLTLRSGATRKLLSTKSVAIFGIGAIGSFVADLLARSGVRSLHLVDGELLRPGNVVRHLARSSQVGLPKVEAVRRCLLDLGLMQAGDVTTSDRPLSSIDEALSIVATRDIVIDATGSGPALAMLDSVLADAHDPSLITVGLFREGGIARLDRYPLGEGEAHLGPIPILAGAISQRLESGCGDPVSLTPPSSVVAAASLATRQTVRLLTGASVPPSTIEIYEAQPDAPYDIEGVLR